MEARWLEILKASGWQLIALSLAFFTFWYLLLLDAECLPRSDLAVIIYGPPLAGLITGFLGLFVFVEQVCTWIAAPIKKHNKAKKMAQELENQQRRFKEHITYMTPKELEIFGYLIEKKQKNFTGPGDGGHAVNLISEGFIQAVKKPKQMYDNSNYPFSVPDHIWSVALDEMECFPKNFNDNSRPWVRSTLGVRGGR